MATDKQIAANRANALKSTGPKTPEGRDRSSRNALRHGLLAKTVLLRAECPDSFRKFVSSFYAEYRPKTATEHALVQIMAVARWRMLRTAGLAVVQVDREFNDPSNRAYGDLDNATRVGLAWHDASVKSGALNAALVAETRYQRQFDSALDRLLRHREALYREKEAPPNFNRDGTAPPPANPQTNPNERLV